MAVQSHDEILEQLLANEREAIERRNRIRRFFGFKSKPVPAKTIKPCLTANTSDKPSVGKKLTCENSLSKVSISKSSPLEHLDIKNLSANVLLQSEMFKSINDSFFRERDFLEGYTSPGSFSNTEKFELGSERLCVYQVYNADQYSEYPRYEKYGESGCVRIEDTQNRIIISLSRYFIYTCLNRSLEKAKSNSLYWQQYAIPFPTPMSKEVAYIDLSIPENRIRDIETNEVIANFTGNPYGAGAVFIDMIASKHGEFAIDWYRYPQAPRDLQYSGKVHSKYMEFLLYEPQGNWCQKSNS